MEDSLGKKDAPLPPSEGTFVADEAVRWVRRRRRRYRLHNAPRSPLGRRRAPAVAWRPRSVVGVRTTGFCSPQANALDITCSASPTRGLDWLKYRLDTMLVGSVFFRRRIGLKTLQNGELRVDTLLDVCGVGSVS
jgi:hypothetical protein